MAGVNTNSIRMRCSLISEIYQKKIKGWFFFLFLISKAHISFSNLLSPFLIFQFEKKWVPINKHITQYILKAEREELHYFVLKKIKIKKKLPCISPFFGQYFYILDQEYWLKKKEKKKKWFWMDWEKVVQIFVLFFLICLYVSTMLKCILLGKKKA